MKTIALNNGLTMPLLGLGTWKMSDAEAEAAVRFALEAGYRLIDTATLYGNEKGVGKAIRESGIAREEIFLTTKLWPTDFAHPEKAFEKSLSLLGLNYVDLYLVHWPVPLMPKKVWLAMEAIYASKKARAIGVSNYSSGDIEKLLGYASVVPAANQIKFSPFDFEKDTLDYCRGKGIVLEAYSPLTRGTHLKDATVAAIAHQYGKSPAQVMIRWCIEHEVVAIPKSSHPERIKENFDVFDFSLSSQDMQVLDAASR